MNVTEIESLKKKLLEQYKRDIDAINRVAELLQGATNGNGEHPVVERAPDLPQLRTRTRFVNVRQAVRYAAKRMDGEFGIDQIEKFIRETNADLAANMKREDVSFGLWKMAKEGELKVIQQGRGRRPSIYCKV